MRAVCCGEWGRGEGDVGRGRGWVASGLHTDVSDIATFVRAVTEDRAADVRNNMHVCSAAAIVAGEDGGELGDTVSVGGLQTAQEGVVEVGGVVVVAVAIADDLVWLAVDVRFGEGQG